MNSTKEVAAMFSLDRRHLNMILARHNRLRPAHKITFGGFSAYQWTEPEIDALRQYLRSIGNVSENNDQEDVQHE